MKKIIIFILLLLSSILFTLGACDRKLEEEQAKTVDIKVIIKDTEERVYPVRIDDKNSKNGLFSILDYLQIKYEFDQGEFTKVGSLTADYTQLESITLIAIYTNIEENFDKSIYADTFVYNSEVFVNIAKAPNEIVFKNGGIFYFKTKQI